MSHYKITFVTPNPLQPATKLQSGAFVIGKVLGSGGFGVTYYSGDMKLRRYVAIKEFFPPDCIRNGNQIVASNNTDFVQAKNKFIEEARTLAQFNHSGIVKVLTVFEENGTAYMVMEFLKGKTLQQQVEESGVLREGEALEYIQKVGEALQAVHESQIIHRDIKPENIIICEDGRVVLIDFGLNKKIETAGNYQTRRFSTTKQLGTDGYSPAEQYLRHAQTGTFTDVYSLAATLYFMLTNQVPISAPQRAMSETLLPPHRLNPSTSPVVSAAVMKAMEIDEKQRPQTVRDFLDLLKPGIRIPQKNSGSVSLDHYLSNSSLLIPPLITVTQKPIQPDFRKVSWGMSKQQVRTIETASLFDEAEDILVYTSNIAGLQCQIIFIFAFDQLVRAKYSVIEQHSHKNIYIDDYDRLKSLLVEKYGNPISDDTYWLDYFYKDDFQNWGMAISMGHCSKYAKWINQGTNIILGLDGDNFSIDLILEYSCSKLSYLEEEKIKQMNFNDL